MIIRRFKSSTPHIKLVKEELEMEEMLMVKELHNEGTTSPGECHEPLPGCKHVYGIWKQRRLKESQPFFTAIFEAALRIFRISHRLAGGSSERSVEANESDGRRLCVEAVEPNDIRLSFISNLNPSCSRTASTAPTTCTWMLGCLFPIPTRIMA